MGWYSQNFLRKFLKISITLGIYILFFKTESSFSKQILLEVHVTYEKKPNFYV